MTNANVNLKHDRMRFIKNKTSANLALLGIVFNVLYFVSIYSSDVGNYYYKAEIGISVVYNLLFLLITFLSSEGVKSYKLSYSYILIGVGAMQIVRIFKIPLEAVRAVITVSGAEEAVMSGSQFAYVTVMLTLSAVCCIAGGIIGVIRTGTLEAYNKSLAEGEKN